MRQWKKIQQKKGAKPMPQSSASDKAFENLVVHFVICAEFGRGCYLPASEASPLRCCPQGEKMYNKLAQLLLSPHFGQPPAALPGNEWQLIRAGVVEFCV
jgi:hypothetical protein